jgi:flagellar hook assembly protein FlgD
MAPGAAIPPNWYNLLRPWSFDIHDVRLQRGGVTILNNVINPVQGEKAQVRYHLVNGGRVTIQVFTLDGNMVKVLYRGWRAQGEYIEVWDGKNNGGRSVARGMYFVRVVAPDIDEIRKVMVVK